MKIGIDFGGVIVKASEGEDFDPSLGESIAIPDSLSVISKLSEEHEIFIISKASRRVQSFTRRWLSAVNFYQIVSFNPNNLIFCEKRSQKASLCQQCGIDWFIDDNQEVISWLEGVVKNRTLFDDSISWRELLAQIQSK